MTILKNDIPRKIGKSELLLQKFFNFLETIKKHLSVGGFAIAVTISVNYFQL